MGQEQVAICGPAQGGHAPGMFDKDPAGIRFVIYSFATGSRNFLALYFSIMKFRLPSFKTAETVFLMPSAEYTYLSSTMVKQIARLNGDITDFVPEHVKKYLNIKYK